MLSYKTLVVCIQIVVMVQEQEQDDGAGNKHN